MESLPCVLEKFQIKYALKKEQREVISHVLQKHNVFCMLPTGYGKTDTFILPPLVLDEIHPDQTHITLVVSPLRGLMKDQVKRCHQRSIRAEFILKKHEMTSDAIKRIRDGNLNILFASPEALLLDEWRRLFRSKAYKTRLCLVAFDEAHCICEWGDDFRPKYKELSVLRSLVPGDVPFLFATATATPKLRQSILDAMHITTCSNVCIIPDRPNLFLEIKATGNFNVEKELTWYIEHLSESSRLAKKMIIYCRSINMVSSIYEIVIECLGTNAWINGDKCASNRLVDMFHSAVSSDTEVRVLNEFSIPDSVLRCLVSTVAFGMGIEIPDIEYVVHWGAPKSVLDYWQEVGRCGRDGRRGYACMYPLTKYLNLRFVGGDMLKIIKTRSQSNCFRKDILQNFSFESQTNISMSVCRCNGECVKCVCELCSCCSLCKARCPCVNE